MGLKIKITIENQNLLAEFNDSVKVKIYGL